MLAKAKIFGMAFGFWLWESKENMRKGFGFGCVIWKWDLIWGDFIVNERGAFLEKDLIFDQRKGNRMVEIEGFCWEM